VFSRASSQELDKSIFKKLALGDLSQTAFAIGNAGKALAKDDRIIYDKDSGKLLYDVDGLGGKKRWSLPKLARTWCWITLTFSLSQETCKSLFDDVQIALARQTGSD
jgi:hypothetical protein